MGGGLLAYLIPGSTYNIHYYISLQIIVNYCNTIPLLPKLASCRYRRVVIYLFVAYSISYNYYCFQLGKQVSRTLGGNRVRQYYCKILENISFIYVRNTLVGYPTAEICVVGEEGCIRIPSTANYIVVYRYIVHNVYEFRPNELYLISSSSALLYR